MSKKTFASAPKPKQPTPEQIAAFEQGGAGHDLKPSSPQMRVSSDEENSETSKPQTRISSKTDSLKPAKAEMSKPANEGHDDPVKRLIVDLPASKRARFKTACAANQLKMNDELIAFIERRTLELEEEAGIKR